MIDLYRMIGFSTALLVFGTSAPALAQDAPHTQAFAAAIRQCWMPPATAEDIAVTLDIELSADGAVQRVDGDPELVREKPGLIAFEAGLRAVLECAPYTMFDPDRHDEWRAISLTLHP